jgi:hypothetical protein
LIKYIGKDKMGVVVPKGGRGPGESDREAEGWGTRGDTQWTMIDYSLLWVKGFHLECLLGSRLRDVANLFFLQNSIVYSPTTVHFTNVYDCSF